MIINTYSIILICVSTALTVQGAITIWQMIYGWLDPEKLARNQMPRTMLPPKTRFSLIIPCRHEETVIAATLHRLLEQTYTSDLFEILVPIHTDDRGTIQEVEKVIHDNPDFRIKTLVYNDGPINKPHGLNVALVEAKGDYIAVFDAEDEINPRLLDCVNTVVIGEGRQIIQTGVSLTNWHSHWFSLLAVLEYYTWFNSRLHWYADKNIITLAGAGIFLPLEVLKSLGGWNDKFLTEDAKLGVDCSVSGYKFRVLSEEEFSTNEEVPMTLNSFIQQRTRWIQGFLQVFIDGHWLKLSFNKKIHFLTLVLFPFLQFILYIWVIYSLFFAPRLPMLLVMFSLLPLGILIFQLAIEGGQLTEMLMVRKEYKYIPLSLLLFVVSFIPYQVLMSIAGIRALFRQISGNNSWEKTLHFNSHRSHGTKVPFLTKSKIYE